MPRPANAPNLGLVCQTYSERCRFRTITRTRFLALKPAERFATLQNLYFDNAQRVHAALSFCHHAGLRLYRASSSLFPMSDDPVGTDALESMPATLASVGRRARLLGIRVVIHPDQFVVLNSESDSVVRTSIRILEKHARAFDLMKLERSPWAAMNIHCGKSGRPEELIDVIRSLPAAIRSRLTLENDEHAYGVDATLDICQRARVPMIYDNLHHAVHGQLKSYAHASVKRALTAARQTWPDPTWQIVHLSNGRASFADPHHSDLITDVPPAYRSVPWIEVEAKGKECAIAALQEGWLTSGRVVA